MRAIVQKVGRAQMRVAGDAVGEVGGGLYVLPGVAHGNGKSQIKEIARKITQLRVLCRADGDDGTRRSTKEAGASVLLASQFTLYVDVRKGRSPEWFRVIPDDIAEPVVAAVAEELRRTYGLHVETGKLDAMMDVELVNDDPLTSLIEA